MEPISKSTVHEFARKVSTMIKIAREPRYRRCIAVDETKLRVKKSYVYVWSAVDVDSGEVLAVYASRSRNMLIAIKFMRTVLDRCLNKPMIIVDRGQWYRWALERLGLKYRYQRFSLRNTVERFFRYLKQRTKRFYNNINTWKKQSIEDYAAAIAIIRNILTIMKNQGGVLPS